MDTARIWVNDPVQGRGWITRVAVDGLFALDLHHEAGLIWVGEDQIGIIARLLEKAGVRYAVKYDRVTIPGVGLVCGMTGRAHRDLPFEDWKRYSL